MKRRNFIQMCAGLLCIPIIGFPKRKIQVGDIVVSKRIAKEIYKTKDSQGKVFSIYYHRKHSFPFPFDGDELGWWKKRCPTMKNEYWASVTFKEGCFCMPIEDLEISL